MVREVIIVTEMRKLFLLWTLMLLALMVSCTTSPTTTPSSPITTATTTEVVTSPSPEPIPSTPPWILPEVLDEQTPVPSTPPTATPEPLDEQPPVPTTEPSESQDTLTQFIWTVDDGIRLEDASVPNILRLEDGRFRLYYGGAGGILSAISQDGLAFTKESGVRVASGSQGSLEMIVSDPTLVILNDGRIRMYYKGANGSGGPGQAIHSIFSAISTDGLLFEKEGIRIDSQQTPDGGWASVPEAILLPDGNIRIYYVSNGTDVGHGIVSAVSEDGLNFTREGPVLSSFVDPAIIRLADDSYLMLAVAFPVSKGVKLTDIDPGIYSFRSQDGINFSDRELVLAGEGNIDPAIANMGDGTYRVYYWNATDKPSLIRSITGNLQSTPTSTATAAPTITPLYASRSITGAQLWLFAIDDGNTQLAISAESDGKLLMGRLDITNPNSAVSWQIVASSTDTGGSSIADHWHIFAHGYHWLVFSVSGGSASYLLKLDKDFRRLAMVPVGHTDGPTNDMFLVAEPDGVAVGHFKPGYGHTIHRFDVQANKIGQVSIGGGIYIHTNGSSAIPVEGGYLLFASETLNPSVTSAIRLIQCDTAWNPVNVSTVFDEDGTNAAMPTAVCLDSGYKIVHLRVRTGVSTRQNASSPRAGSLLPDDSGALVRLVLAPDGTIVSRETLVSDCTNRAHTTLVGDLLITTWDETSTVYLRVDRVR